MRENELKEQASEQARECASDIVRGQKECDMIFARRLITSHHITTHDFVCFVRVCVKMYVQARTHAQIETETEIERVSE